MAHDTDIDQTLPLVSALRVDVANRDREIPIHKHRAGQLVMALRGAVSCEVPGTLLIVPPQAGVWIPGCTPHSNHSTANAVIFYLFVEPGQAELPAKCCTLRISPLLSELIQHLSTVSYASPPARATDRLVRVLLDQLSSMPVEELSLPLPDDTRLKRVSQALAADPGDRRSSDDWAVELGLSGRTLQRLCLKETGISFGRWRRQLLLLIALRELAAGRTVQAVAYDLGYESTSAFVSAFKKAFGKPPATYITDRMFTSPAVTQHDSAGANPKL